MGLFDDVPAPVQRAIRRSAQEDYRIAQFAKREVSGNYRLPEIPTLNGEKRIILNAETTGLKWWAGDRPIGWSYILPESGRSGYLPIRHQGENLPLDQVRAFLRDIKHMQVDNANTKFDLHHSREDGVDLCEQDNRFGDVAHYAALLDDNRTRFNLDQLSLDILGWNVERDSIGKQPSYILNEGGFKHLRAETVAPYAIRNVAQVQQLIEAFEPLIEAEDLEETLRLEQDIIPVVVEIEKNGVFLDQDLLHDWQRKATSDLEDKLHAIYMKSGVRVESPDSAKDWIALFKARSLPIPGYTDGGAPSFAAGFVKNVDDECVTLMREAGDLAGLLSMFLDKYARAIRQSDGWLRHNLHQLRYGKDEGERVGAVSGRFSAAGDKHIPPDGLGSGGFNCQQCVAVEKQLERGWNPDYVVRRLFKMNFAADMMQVEYRLFAHYANIASAFHERPKFYRDPKGKIVWTHGPLADFHALVAALLNNPRLNRKLVKNVNFAKIYGAGLIKFAFMIGYITQREYEELSARRDARDWSYKQDPRLQEASAINASYDAMFPAVAPLLAKARETVEERGYVFDLIGRRARPITKPNSALNRIIQGGAASINKRVLIEVYKMRKALGLTMRLTMHDEIGGTLVDPRGAMGLMKRILNHQYFDLRAPILWDAKTGNNWAECK